MRACVCVHSILGPPKEIDKGVIMKFSKYLESQSVPEWRKAYINYKGLKKKLKQVERVRKRAFFLIVNIIYI